METEEERIYYSEDFLKADINEAGDKPELGVAKYLRELRYPPIDEFPNGLEWCNVSEPLTFSKHLKGKIVILDFFTYCCINCMHILPDLKELENAFSVEDGLVVIGVHSAKFENEKDTKNILAACQRYNITHPVVNDPTRGIWKKNQVLCWPTLLVLGPYANPLLMLMGEGHREKLLRYVRHFIDYYKGEDLISDHSLPIVSAHHLLPEMKGPLLFPGKVATFVDGGEEILAISDSGNCRILIVKNGIITKQIGGTMGFKDGTLDKAQFNQPQGVTFLNKDVLFVADTENHAVRKIDIGGNKVTTIAGNGTQVDDQTGGKIGKDQGISSPWDVCVYRTNDFKKTDGPLKDILIVAMAGTHQIWAIFLEDTVWWKSKEYKAGTVVCIAGNGDEQNRNNQYPQNAAFAQPSGLAVRKKTKEVFIADSESSTVRKISMIDGKVSAVVGGDVNPKNLFAYGDKDGSLKEAKLQHALGLAMSVDENTLYVADTYNHKIKKINPDKNEVTTLPNEKQAFNEPAGLCVSSDPSILYVADTNNHRILKLHLSNGNKTEVVHLRTSEETFDKVDSVVSKVLTAPSITINENGGKILLNVAVQLEEGLDLTPGAPNEWRAVLPSVLWSSVPSNGTNVRSVDLVVNAPPLKKGCNLDVAFTLTTCKKDACYPHNFVLRHAVDVSTSGETVLSRTVKVAVNSTKVNII